jgi:SHO1 osmosensor
MGGGAAGLGAGGGGGSTTAVDNNQPDGFPHRAKALYACKLAYYCHDLTTSTFYLTDTASPDDPNEISFTKGEILDIVDKQGKWWQAKNADGTVGSASLLRDFVEFTVDFSHPVAPSNYLQII